MGGLASQIGHTRLTLSSPYLVPSEQLLGSIELSLYRSLVLKHATFTLQSREHATWQESYTVYTPQFHRTYPSQPREHTIRQDPHVVYNQQHFSKTCGGS